MSSVPSVRIRSFQHSDLSAITDIYNHYIATSIATFEELPLSADEMRLRVQAVYDAGYQWLIATREPQVLGYAYSAPWNRRSAYRYSAEVSVYVDAQAAGEGVGSALYDALFQSLREQPVRTVMAGISLPNEASVALHEKFGMRQVARYSDVGYKFGQWIDVGYWQLILEGTDVPVSE